MPELIDSAISNLQKEEQTLLSKKSDLDRQASELDSALKRVRGALIALGVPTVGKSGGRKGSAKPSPVKAVVRETVVAILQTNTPQADELRAEVERRLKERGYSRMGLSLRLKEVLGEDQFTESPDGYQLAQSQDAASTEAVPIFNEQVTESA